MRTGLRGFIIIYDRAAPRRAVNLSVNEDLLRRMKALTPNLSRTVEELLAGFVEAEYARKRAEDTALEGVIEAVNARIEKYGLLSDDFISF